VNVPEVYGSCKESFQFIPLKYQSRNHLKFHIKSISPEMLAVRFYIINF